MTSFATVIGAIPGALPPVIGWAAAREELSQGAWLLFGIVFLWQLPHFLSIAWMFRDDYARAGFLMLPVLEPDGRSTGRQTIIYAAALVPLSLAPTLIGLTGRAYFAGALALAAIFMTLAVKFALSRSRPDAQTPVLRIDHLSSVAVDIDDRESSLRGRRRLPEKPLQEEGRIGGPPSRSIQEENKSKGSSLPPLLL